MQPESWKAKKTRQDFCPNIRGPADPGLHLIEILIQSGGQPSVTSTIPDLSDNGIEVASLLEQQLLSNHIDVPMLPDVASRVLHLSNDPDSDAQQLANLIQSDQALAGHVMRIANSAAYTPNASMVSLQQAVARLGMDLIAEIAIAASLNSRLFKAPGFEKRMDAIWQHALCAAFWGKEIARAAKQNVEASFLCGLLHSIGRPAVLQCIADLEAKHEAALSPDENRLLEDRYHVDYGVAIVEKWEMPVIVRESVKYYLNYGEAENKAEQAMVVYAAAKAAQVTLWPEEFSAEQLKLDEVFADLNLYEDEIEGVLDREDVVKAGVEAIRA